jgi:aspartyl-tRNA(Asn)/glutamyl-tRNA(Gln) amidotransferase subunit C
MAISLEELKHIALLARLRLSEGELMAMHSDLNRVLDHFMSLQQLDLAGIPLTSHSVDVHSIWEQDEPVYGFDHEDALSGAPMAESGLFLVPPIID